ncbi:YoaK family protein [Nonomuraea sp. NPDC046802]|uniref:YoaK family protein n=1 Tax=Nonomuraea sp. NPDC046802 TaxID=3154919 RepID=UPI0033E5A2F8
MRFGAVPLLGLAFAAGAVDALSFLRLGEVFTANMTGNIVLLGLALGTGHTEHALGSGLALAAFLMGLAAGFFLLKGAGDRSLRPLAGLTGELALLVAMAVGWAAQTPRPALIVLSGTAMGLQSAITRWVCDASVSTTYVTGTLTSMAGQIIGPPAARSGARWPLAVVLALAAGAVFAALTLRLYPPAAPLVAPAAVAFATSWWAIRDWG